MNLSHIELGAFSHQQKLISLDLSVNELNKLDFKLFYPALHDLKSLLIADNHLKDLNGFRNALFPGLALLDIKNNDFNCSYLEYFMESVNWEKLRLSIDSLSVSPIESNIRGIKCHPVDQSYSFENSTTKYRLKTLQKLVVDISIIKFSLIFMCMIASAYFFLFLILNSELIFKKLTGFIRICLWKRKVSSTIDHIEF